MRLRDRVALVTAGGSGMGRAGSRRFAEEGAHVIVTDIDESSAKETAAMIESAGGSAEARHLDVKDVEETTALFEEVDRTHGVLHVLYDHAGVPGAAGLDVSPEEWDLAIDTNVKGSFYVATRAVPLLKRAEGRGSIIFTASISGIVGSPFSPLYSLAKGGVVLLMKSMALNLAPDVRCNAICPGPVDTPMLPQFFGRESGANVSDLMDGFLKTVPLGRPARPEEIANVALFLACDESSFVTGVALPVDGGYVAR
jgi:NAD(P)-dependent dehydrogenase (short-subunit alcohol dehydrogenase family)